MTVTVRKRHSQKAPRAQATTAMVAVHGAAAPAEPNQVPKALATEDKLEDMRKKRKPRYVRAKSASMSPTTGPGLHI